jgi:hypothetical protein
VEKGLIASRVGSFGGDDMPEATSDSVNVLDPNRTVQKVRSDQKES